MKSRSSDRVLSLPRHGVPAAALAITFLLLAGAAHTARAETEREYCERQQGFAKDVCLRDLDKPAVKPKPAAAATPAAAQAPTPTTPTAPTTASPASPASPATATATAGPASPRTAAGGAALYKVVGGDKVDAETLKGFRAWRAAACDRCHGANQEGLVGPSLITSLKTLSKDEFVTVVKNGRLEKGMQSFGNSPIVMDNIDQLYAYLKGRSDGAITKAHVRAIP